MLELNKVELSKIGITLEKDSIKLLYETEIDFVNQPKMKDYLKSMGIETDLNKIYVKTPTFFKFNASLGKDSIISWSADFDRIAPIIVNTFNFEYEDNKYINAGAGCSSKSSKLTSENDRIFVNELMKLTSKVNLENLRKSTFIDLKTNKETSLVNKLLPVKIILGDSTKKVEGNKYSEVIVWLVPTPEFVGALPDRYRSEIEAELNIIAKVESGLASQDELCKETKVGFFNICNNDNNIKSVNAYPNPVQNEINLEFKLDKKAKVSINLKDISGKIIKNLITDLYLENQSFSQKLNLEGITQGMYLLEIKSSDGSIVIQKILKN
ncbi:MAG: T9SS type A sorting domain-containing protein [Candidatus Kapabacteria bacterium]|nr:T9SS type A sorting domain-containing protein [Candidatus Kapabacteria bacterium]